MLENLDLSGRVIATLNPETNELINVSSRNADYCTIRVESSVLANDEGLLMYQKRVAKLRMQTILAESLKANGMLSAGKELPIKGKIIVRESFEPFYDGQEPKVNPRTGEMVLYMEAPVYRQTVFTSSETARDVFIRDLCAGQTAEVATEQANNAPVAFEQFMQAEFV
ncbi:hypothetical protein LJB98_05770 [Bacteroidales bacterium OttesenSCG-928-M11]|nr:hypothetical protein [Bacteroidales bacterium OttesenSCG-928-M11]